ncbi:MAG: PGF-pre-PGF domain-containing protein, partial [Candidatus Aenigmatarchaeota archaeon]
NNFFNNSINFYFEGNVYKNFWNTTKQLGQRIYSPGNQVGGNYWTNSNNNGYSDTCQDSDKDGFCDSPYTLSATNIDYLPLSDEYLETTQFPPILAYSLESPSLPTYSQRANYYFNITACDPNGESDISTVLFEWSNQNTTVINYIIYNSTCRNYSIAKIDLAAGTYNYKWFANDSSNSWASLSDSYTINKAPNLVNLYFNGTLNSNKSYTYPEAINSTGIGIGIVYLYRNNIIVASALNSVTEQIVLGNGTYSYKANSSGNQNYSANSSGITYYVLINKASPSLSIAPLTPVTYLTLTQTGCGRISGDPSSTLTLFRNSTQVASGTFSPINESSIILGAGTYNYSCIISETQNYTSGSLLNQHRTINKAPNPLDIYFINSTGTFKNQNITVIAGTQTTANVSALYPNSGTLYLYEDNLPVSNPRTTILSLGEHSYKGNSSGNQNYTANSTGLTYYIKVIDDYPPQYSLASVNSTKQGSAISHNLFWQDNYQLSHAIFSFDNCTGEFQNVSIISLSGNQAWSNFTVTINETVGCKIRWKVYANDTNNNWASSLDYNYVTSSEAYCGNRICDQGEDCHCQDCPCPGSSGCCGSSCGCAEGKVCQNNVCVSVTQPPSPPTPPPECPKDFEVISQEKNASIIVKCIEKYQTRNFTIPNFILYNLTIKANSTIYNFIIRIKRIPESYLDQTIRIEKKPYYYLEFSNENLNEKNLEKITARFKVEKSWIYSSNINASTIGLYVLTTSWEKLNTYKIEEDSYFIYFESTLPSLSLFAIAGEEKISLPPPECPVCPEPSEWSKCVQGERNRTSYACSEETGFECLGYTETEECEEEKKEFQILYVTIPIIACIPFLLFFYFRKRAKPKEEFIIEEKEIVCPRCGKKMKKSYSGRSIDIYDCKRCGYSKAEIKPSYFRKK